MNFFRIIPLLLLCLTLGACVTTAQSVPVADAPGEYVLGVGDTVRVHVYGEEQMSQEYTVEPGGAISLPLIGPVGAAGYTPLQLQENIVGKLHPDYLVNPRVSVDVAAFRSIYVLGEVQKPGQYEYAPNMTVLQAVAMAGGYTYRANEDSADVTRHVKGALSTFTVDNRTILKPGDTIVVKRRWF